MIPQEHERLPARRAALSAAVEIPEHLNTGQMIECEQPTRKTRRGIGKSDPIDTHLAVLTALQLNTDKLPTPRADGDREALRILLCARQELTTTSTAQTNRLRALLRDGTRPGHRVVLPPRALSQRCRLRQTRRDQPD